MKKHIALFLTLALLANTLISCSTTTSTETIEGPVSSAVIETEPVPEETQPKRLDKLPDLDFEGADFTVFNGGDKVFAVEEQTGELLNDTTFERQITAEERLNIKVKEENVAHGVSGEADYNRIFPASVAAGLGSYYLSSAYSALAGSLAMKGCFINIYDLPYLDFSQDYYSQLLLNQTVINNKLYFVTGDIDYRYLANTCCIIFNKNMMNDYNISENLYDLVLSGDWTLDKFMSLTAGIYQDLNNNGEKDSEDRFGYYTHTAWIDGFWQAAELSWVTVSDGVPEISEDIFSERAVSLVEKFYEFTHDNIDVYLIVGGERTEHAMAEGRALLQTRSFNTLANDVYREAEYSFGILPFPKFDSEQKDYYAFMEYSLPMASIPTDVKNPDMSAAFIELMAAEGMRRVIPNYYEVVLKTKYADTTDDSRMFDIIKNRVTFDLGCVFLNQLNSIASLFRSTIRANSLTWASSLKSNEKIYRKTLEKLVQSFEN